MVGVLHVMPTDSAGDAMRAAISASGREDGVIAFRDDLSCGPISSGDPTSRAAWWSSSCDAAETEQQLREFWDHVEGADAQIVLWYSRFAARELAFFLACCDRLSDQPLRSMDVGAHVSPPSASPQSALSSRLVSFQSPEKLSDLLDLHLSLPTAERRENAAHWARLRAENAAFRIAGPNGLSSATSDHFDDWLLSDVAVEWRSANLVIGTVLAYHSEPYHQVGEVMLRQRLIALADAGRVELAGSPFDRDGQVRLPIA